MPECSSDDRLQPTSTKLNCRGIGDNMGSVVSCRVPCWVQLCRISCQTDSATQLPPCCNNLCPGKRQRGGTSAAILIWPLRANTGWHDVQVGRCNCVVQAALGTCGSQCCLKVTAQYYVIHADASQNNSGSQGSESMKLVHELFVASPCWPASGSGYRKR